MIFTIQISILSYKISMVVTKQSNEIILYNMLEIFKKLNQVRSQKYLQAHRIFYKLPWLSQVLDLVYNYETSDTRFGLNTIYLLRVWLH